MTTLRRPLLFLAALTCVVLGWIYFSDGRSPLSRAFLPAMESSRDTTTSAQGMAFGELTEPPSLESGRGETTSLAAESDSALGRGRIRVGPRPDRLTFFEGNGRLYYRSLEFQPDELSSLEVTRGYWEPSRLVGDPRSLIVDHLLLEDRRAIPLDPVFPILTRGTSIPLLVEATWAGELEFLVTDEDTGEPLENVEVRYGTQLSPRQASGGRESEVRAAILAKDLHGLNAHLETKAGRAPGPDCEVLIASQASPLRVEERSLSGTYWFRAPGHRWVAWPDSKISRAPPYCITLPRAGVLRVSIEGSENLPPYGAAFLRLYRGPVQVVDPFESRPVGGSSEFVIDSLEYGTYTVQVEMELAEDGPRQLASEVVRLSDATQDVRLVLVNDLWDLGAVAGEILVAGATDGLPRLSSLVLASLTVRRTHTADLILSEAEPGIALYSIQRTEVPIGEYLLYSPEYPSGWVVDVSDRETYLQLEIGDLEQRTIEFVDSVTGVRLLPEEGAVITWSRCLPLRDELGVPGILPYSQDLQVQDGKLTGLLPSGSMTIEILSHALGTHEVSVSIEPDQRAIPVGLDRKPRVDLVARANGREIPMGLEWLDHLQVHDARHRIVMARPTWQWNADMQAPRVTVWLPEAGDYVLTPPNLPGSPAFSSLAVHVSREEPTTAVFESDH